jgi:hypothetical protein
MTDIKNARTGDVRRSGENKFDDAFREFHPERGRKMNSRRKG